MLSDTRIKLQEAEIENEALKDYLDKLHAELDHQRDDLKELTQQFFKLKEKYLGTKRAQVADKIPLPITVKKKNRSKDEAPSMVSEGNSIGDSMATGDRIGDSIATL
jgi:hypothetical protein